MFNLAGGGGNVQGYNADFTWVAFFCCLIAASGGALFGYDNGVMGGVTSMDGFLDKFFPSIKKREAETPTVHNLYCQYNSQTLQLMTSSLFIAGALCELSGTTAWLSRNHGRKRVMMYSGALFMVAAIILACAEHISVIVIGRVFQGVAISFASVSVPIYNSEMAPPHLRGRFNQLYQIILTLFILVAQVINLIINLTNAVRWGWRLSLGFAFVPSSVLFLGGIFLPDSPNSLLERGFPEQARKNLEYVRGRKDVDKEFNDLVEAAHIASQCKNPWGTIFSKKYWPQLVLSAFSTTFQQWTGINTLIFYAPQLFLALGTTKNISLIAAIILGACNHLSTYVAWWTADIFGRKTLFLQAGFQMAGALIVVAVSLKCLGQQGVWMAWYILAIICVYDMAYAWSWGPLGWLYPTEIQTLETRSCGLAVASFCNLLFSAVIAQTFLTMLCSLQWGTFLFFACCVIVETILVALLFVEPKAVPIEDCPFLFKKHWFWKRYASRGLGYQEKAVLMKKIESAKARGEAPPDEPGMQQILAELKNASTVSEISTSEHLVGLPDKQL
ncbi:TPA: Transcription factor stp1 [Trebouxia sp. C0004]